MTVDHFHRFLVETQKEEKITKEEAQAIIDHSIRDLKHLPVFHRKALNLEAFFKYITSDNNPPVSPSLGVIFILEISNFVFGLIIDIYGIFWILGNFWFLGFRCTMI